MSDRDRIAADRVLLETLHVFFDDRREKRDVFGHYTVAVLIQKGWLGLRLVGPRRFEAYLTRAGTRELAAFRRGPSPR